LSSSNSLLMTDAINVHELINKINSQINIIYVNKKIKLDNQVPNLSIDTNQSLFTQLITNVIENIYKHGLKESIYSIILLEKENSISFTNFISSDIHDTSHKGIGVIASNAIADKLNYTIVSEVIDDKVYKTKIYLK
jgi:K+-sensing histidine kinase KdpD